MEPIVITLFGIVISIKLPQSQNASSGSSVSSKVLLKSKIIFVEALFFITELVFANISDVISPVTVILYRPSESSLIVCTTSLAETSFSHFA